MGLTVLYWTTTLLWASFSFVALIDALLALCEAVEDWRYARNLENGRRVVGLGRLRISQWFVFAFLVLAITSGKAVFDLFTSPIPTLAETVANTSLLRGIACVYVFGFWQAKRSNRAMRRRLDEYADVAHQVRSLRTLERQTHKKVEKIDRTVERIDEKLDGEEENG